MADESSAGIENISELCDAVRTTLGPLGANKLILKQGGTVKTTSSGSIVLDELDLENPSLTLLEQTTADFSSRHGDGSTTVATLVGALLTEAESLVEKGLHPTVIENGYRTAMDIASDELELRERPLQEVGIEAVIRTSLTGVRDPNIRTDVGAQVGTAVNTIVDASNSASHQQLKVIPRLGAARSETELVRGVILDANPVTQNMPRRLDEAEIALLSTTVDVPHLSTETSADSEKTVAVDSITDRLALGEAERNTFQTQLQRAIDAGCTAILTTRAINDRVSQLLANRGILGLARIDEEDMSRIARMTGGTIVPGLDEIDASRLGSGSIQVRRAAGRDMTVIESDVADPVFTLFVRAPDPRSVELFQHSVENSIDAALSAKQSGTVVPGGGAIEISAAHAIRDELRSLDGRAQLAAEAFADALSVIPRTLAMNTGLDRHVAIARLHVSHAEGRDTFGVDAMQRSLGDVFETDPIADPPQLKQAAWEAATDLSTKLIRIDDQIAATDLGSDNSDAEAE